jgi:hypothetical protein
VYVGAPYAFFSIKSTYLSKKKILHFQKNILLAAI